MVSLSHYLIVIILLYSVVIKIPSGTVLSKEESKIDAFKECVVRVQETAHRMKHSDTVIRNYFKLDYNYAKRMKTKGNSKITSRTIIRSNGSKIKY